MQSAIRRLNNFLPFVTCFSILSLQNSVLKKYKKKSPLHV